MLHAWTDAHRTASSIHSFLFFSFFSPKRFSWILNFFLLSIILVQLLYGYKYLQYYHWFIFCTYLYEIVHVYWCIIYLHSRLKCYEEDVEKNAPNKLNIHIYGWNNFKSRKMIICNWKHLIATFASSSVKHVQLFSLRTVFCWPESVKPRNQFRFKSNSFPGFFPPVISDHSVKNMNLFQVQCKKLKIQHSLQRWRSFFSQLRFQWTFTFLLKFVAFYCCCF